mmetsp:Transcript_35400/g.87989  ORF Transcript_35400/g.87989 Transcript_35400/m.87989 type:complete len:87 (+) Transcript_35400:259-519(+)
MAVATSAPHHEAYQQHTAMRNRPQAPQHHSSRRRHERQSDLCVCVCVKVKGMAATRVDVLCHQCRQAEKVPGDMRAGMHQAMSAQT